MAPRWSCRKLPVHNAAVRIVIMFFYEQKSNLYSYFFIFLPIISKQSLQKTKLFITVSREDILNVHFIRLEKQK